MELFWHANIVTMRDGKYHLIEDGAVAVVDNKITWLGASHDADTQQADRVHDLQGRWLTPALIDCHTHLVYAGSRVHDYVSRLAGKSYLAIAAEGGGILSTVKATRAASMDALYQQSAKRLEAMLAKGVRTLEIKSGYGLDLENERKILEVAAKLEQAYEVRIQKTFLGAHALPPEFIDKDDYIEYLCQAVLPSLYHEGLIDAVDVYCDEGAFDSAQAEKIFQKATELSLPIKCHAEQLAAMGASQTACRYGARSVDHLEHLAQADVALLKSSHTVAVLLPGAYYYLKETQAPPVAALYAAGIPVAIASDCNPGTSPCTDLLFIMHLACQLFSLTPEQALAGVTIAAAQALGLDKQIGSIEVGKQAEFCVWDIQSADELCAILPSTPNPVTPF